MSGVILAGTALAAHLGADTSAQLATPHDAGRTAKLHGDLPEVLAAAPPDRLIPVKAIMREEFPRAEITQLRAITDRDARRDALRALLKPFAERSQRGLLTLLRNEQAAGSVGSRIRTLWMANVVAAEVTRDVAYKIAQRDDVALLAHNPLVKVFDDPPADGGPLAAGVECGVELMGAPRVWNELGITGRGAIVAMIDSGTCYRHPDLKNQIWNNPGEIPGNGKDDDNNGFVDDVIGWNFHLNNNDPDDFLGHGTHTAGTVAGDGTGGTQTGMAPGAKLMLLRVSGSFADEVMVWDAMQYAVDNGAHVWNMSLGWPHSRNPVRKTWRDLCLVAIDMGLTPVIAAGNEGSCCPPFDHTRTPGDVPEVITAGATDCNDNIASFSSRGPVTWKDVNPYNDLALSAGQVEADGQRSGREHGFYAQVFGLCGVQRDVDGDAAHSRRGGVDGGSQSQRRA